MKNRNRQTQLVADSPTSAEQDPSLGPQASVPNDTAAPEPTTNGTTPPQEPEHDAGPSLAGIPAPQAALSPLEERLRRLEEALSQAPDPKQIESRIADRVAERLSEHKPIPVAQIAPTPPAAPQTGTTVTIPTSMLLNVGKHLLNTTASLAKTNAVPGTPGTPEHQETALMSGIRRTYWFFDLLTELRAMWCMYTDPRYRMSWAGRLVPIGLAAFILTSGLWFPGSSITLFGTFIDKIADVIPALILYKWLSYEARRYRETAPDLPPELRL